ncbi:MAG: 30S ribosomal protein S12 methylthiotransferase RimO [Phycisphaerales bacterium JB037]
MPDRSDSPSSHNDPRAGDIRTVSFVSLGCPKNLVDSEKMLGLLADDGLMPVSFDPSRDLAERWDDALHVEGESGQARLEEGAGEPGNATAVQADPAIEPADAVVINTCGFLEASKQESLGAIRDAVRAKEAGLVKRVVVAGCLVQRHRAKMLEWAPGIDAMIGVFDRDRIVEAVRGVRPDREDVTANAAPYWIAGNALQAAKERGMSTVGLTVQGKDGSGLGYFESDAARLRLTPRHYAYLRISEGCNQKCAFCTIPSIRGKMRSKPVDRIADEARELRRDGAFELNLIGQDTTSFGDDLGIGLGQVAGDDRYRGGLPMMLRAVCDAASAEGDAWVRLMYAYPSNFSDEMIDAFAELCARGPLVPYIDMPLQHASDRMLEKMRRNVTADHQRELLHKLRDRVPGIALRTTFISGFPGETEEDHEQLLGFIDEIGFDAVGVFEYSREPGTPAGRMEEDPALAVPEEVKARRKREVLELQQQIAFDQARYLADQFDPAAPAESGCHFDVLIDEARGVDEDGKHHWSAGRCYFQAPGIDAVTLVHSREKLSPGELVRCAITDADGYDLIARPVRELEKRTSLPLL